MHQTPFVGGRALPDPLGKLTTFPTQAGWMLRRGPRDRKWIQREGRRRGGEERGKSEMEGKEGTEKGATFDTATVFDFQPEVRAVHGQL